MDSRAGVITPSCHSRAGGNPRDSKTHYSCLCFGTDIVLWNSFGKNELHLYLDLMNKKPLILLLLSLCAAPVFAQSDTVESRSVTSKIGDSASIRYHLGALCLEQSGVKQFLHFKNIRPSSELPLNYQTRDFTITTGTPTLSMFRFARFDGSSSLLNATTTILYIVEICNSTTGAVLARVDTLACYVDDKGALGYTTYPPSNQYPHCNLSTIATGTTVYARLERIASLPPGVTIHDEPDAEIIFGYPPLDNIISYPASETEFYSEVPNTTSDTFPKAIAPPPVKAYFMDSIGGRFISYPGDRITSKPCWLHSTYSPCVALPTI